MAHKYLRVLFITLFVGTLIAGCSSRDFYEALRENRINECKKEPPGERYDQCMARQAQSYEQYETMREEAKRQH